jgi:CobQ-like glutamine amidotransferase family enzyme
MCEVCAVFGVGQHWTDAADPMGSRNVAAGILENRTERAKRLQLINRILQRTGLAVSDWDGESYSVEDAQGRREIAPDLSALWRVAEGLGKVHIDPLNADFLLPTSPWSDSYRASN